MNDLNKLIENFLLNYTFNNIDILLSNRKILSLEKEDLEDKLIRRKRGGYCFENNQYFFNSLKEKGYEVNRYLGRVVYGGPDDVPRTHQLSIVTIDGAKFLADVGFGPYTPGVSVPLSGEEAVAFNGNSYRIVKLNESDYQLEILKKDGPFSLYQFNLVDYKKADFKISNYYTNTHDDSKFTKNLILSQQDKLGMKFLTGLTYTCILNEERVDIDIQDSEKFIEILKKNFNISYSDEELLSLFNWCQKIGASRL